MGDQEYNSKGKTVHLPGHPKPCQVEKCPEFYPIVPYEDAVIELKTRLYNKNEKKTEINEYALDLFIDRVLLSATINLDQQRENYGIMDVEDGIMTHPNNIVGHRDDDPMPYQEQSKKDRKSDKKGRKGKKNETKADEKRLKDYVVATHPYDSSGLSDTLIMQVGDFRSMMIAEVYSRARNIHEFYEFQWNKLHGERIIALRNLVVWKEYNTRIQKELQEAVQEIKRLKEQNDKITTDIQKKKIAKKQKRNAAKQRKFNGFEVREAASHT